VTDGVLITVAAAITYVSRAAAVVFLPVPTGRLLSFVRRLPAPLFAGLAVFALVGDQPTVPDLPAACAAGGAIAAAPFRSLAVTLAAGLAAFAVGSLLG